MLRVSLSPVGAVRWVLTCPPTHMAAPRPPSFIKGMASTTNILVRFYTPVALLTESGRPWVPSAV